MLNKFLLDVLIGDMGGVRDVDSSLFDGFGEDVVGLGGEAQGETTNFGGVTDLLLRLRASVRFLTSSSVSSSSSLSSSSSFCFSLTSDSTASSLFVFFSGDPAASSSSMDTSRLPLFVFFAVLVSVRSSL